MILFVLEALTALVLILLLIWWTIAGGRKHKDADPADPHEPHLAHVRFTDNGQGIPAEALPRLFERGFTSKARGSGIGLHWCANTMAAMGGRIHATSDGPGRGACVHLLLPLADQHESSTEATA